MEKIILNSRKNDPHTIGITKELDQLGESFIILDSFTPKDFFQIQFKKGINSGMLNVHGQEIDLSDVKSVWNTSPLSIKIDNDLIEESKNFVKAEWTEGISSLWNSFSPKWVNNPNSILSTVNRLKQLQLASNVGLKTPNTIVTNNPKRLESFFEECNEEIIAKTLHSSEGLSEDKMIFTTKLSKKDLEQATQLQYTPCMFQEYVPKNTELRVTIIGDIFHAAEIFSQQSEKTKHDWRQYDDFEKTPYKQIELSDNIKKTLLRLMKNMNLEFGAVDLIRTPNDEYVFLEVNPNGRWWWIQELTGMNIAKDIALHLSH